MRSHLPAKVLEDGIRVFSTEMSTYCVARDAWEAECQALTEKELKHIIEQEENKKKNADGGIFSSGLLGSILARRKSKKRDRRGDAEARAARKQQAKVL